MAAPSAVEARWPQAPGGRGHYESYFLRAVHPSEPRGVWIRYTALRPPGRRPTGQLWFTLFDRSAGRPRAVRVDAGEPSAGGGDWIRLGDARFGAAEVSGTADAGGASASWALRYRSDAPALLHLPRPWMYTSRLPRTKLVSPGPAAVFDGEVRLGGELVSLTGWPGTVGHNWGEQHAERWVWLHGIGFDGAGLDTWIDVAVGRLRLGGVTTPWLANGAVSLDGERLPLGGLRRRATVAAEEDHCVLRLPGPDVLVTASVSAPSEAFVEWDYADPGGASHRVLNCSVADLRLRVQRPGRSPTELNGPARGVYEHGSGPHSR